MSFIGPVAQWESTRLACGWPRVQIPPGPPSSGRGLAWIRMAAPHDHFVESRRTRVRIPAAASLLFRS